MNEAVPALGSEVPVVILVLPLKKSLTMLRELVILILLCVLWLVALTGRVGKTGPKNMND